MFNAFIAYRKWYSIIDVNLNRVHLRKTKCRCVRRFHNNFSIRKPDLILYCSKAQIVFWIYMHFINLDIVYLSSIILSLSLFRLLYILFVLISVVRMQRTGYLCSLFKHVWVTIFEAWQYHFNDHAYLNSCEVSFVFKCLLYTFHSLASWTSI